MHIDPRRAFALIAALAALAVAIPAAADTGPDRSGGTAADQLLVDPSGGVAGPAVEDGARSSQAPGSQHAQEEQPPEIEEPAPEEEEVPEEVPDTDTDEAPDETAEPAPSAGTGGGGGGLPATGLEIGALSAVGLGLLLAGLALRRRPSRPL